MLRTCAYTYISCISSKCAYTCICVHVCVYPSHVRAMSDSLIGGNSERVGVVWASTCVRVSMCVCMCVKPISHLPVYQFPLHSRCHAGRGIKARASEDDAVRSTERTEPGSGRLGVLLLFWLLKSTGEGLHRAPRVDQDAGRSGDTCGRCLFRGVEGIWSKVFRGMLLST